MTGLLLDENLSAALADALNRQNPDVAVRRIGDGIAPPLGTPDPEILLWIEEHDFILMTNNRASMPAHLKTHVGSGRHVPGIVQIPRRFHMGSLAEHILVLVGASTPGELQDVIWYIQIREST